MYKGATLNKILSNEEIYGYTVVVIDETGTNKGEMVKRAAIIAAKDKGFDLIQVGKNDKGLSICKYGDAGKMKYEASKKAAPKPVKLKEMTFGLNEGSNDILVKKNKVRGMLEKKCMVKFAVEVKGRERAFMETAKQLLRDSVADLSDVAKWDDLKTANTPRSVIIFVILKPTKDVSNADQSERKG